MMPKGGALPDQSAGPSGAVSVARAELGPCGSEPRRADGDDQRRDRGDCPAAGFRISPDRLLVVTTGRDFGGMGATIDEILVADEGVVQATGVVRAFDSRPSKMTSPVDHGDFVAIRGRGETVPPHRHTDWPRAGSRPGPVPAARASDRPRRRGTCHAVSADRPEGVTREGRRRIPSSAHLPAFAAPPASRTTRTTAPERPWSAPTSKPT